MGRHPAGKRQAAKEMRQSMTDAEQLLWVALRKNQLDGLHFRRQQVIDGFIVDFYCHAAGLIVEVDGPYHEDQKEYDTNRDQIMATHGLHTLRFTNDQIQNHLPTALQKILTTARITNKIPDESPP